MEFKNSGDFGNILRWAGCVGHAIRRFGCQTGGNDIPVHHSVTPQKLFFTGSFLSVWQQIFSKCQLPPFSLLCSIPDTRYFFFFLAWCDLRQVVKPAFVFRGGVRYDGESRPKIGGSPCFFWVFLWDTLEKLKPKLDPQKWSTSALPRGGGAVVAGCVDAEPPGTFKIFPGTLPSMLLAC